MAAKLAYLKQTLDKVEGGIRNGETRRRKIENFAKYGITEEDIVSAVKNRDMRVAQIGNNYVFAPATYTIRPL